jgi:hypothetical protein
MDRWRPELARRRAREARTPTVRREPAFAVMAVQIARPDLPAVQLARRIAGQEP